MKSFLLTAMFLTGAFAVKVDQLKDENFQEAQSCVNAMYPSAKAKCLSRIDFVPSLGKRCRVIAAALPCLLQESHAKCGDKGDKVLIAGLTKSGESLSGKECELLHSELSEKFLADWGTYEWQSVETQENSSALRYFNSNYGLLTGLLICFLVLFA